MMIRKEIKGMESLEIEISDDVIWLYNDGDCCHPGHIAFWRKDIPILIKELEAIQHKPKE